VPNRSTKDAEQTERSVAHVEPYAQETVPRNGTSFSWRESLTSALYHTGILGALRGVSRHFEVDVPPGSRWPRWRKATSPKFLILCYHRIGTGGVPLYSELPQSIFEAQMRFLREHYRIVSLEEVCLGLRSGIASGPAIAVTFDDGYAGVFTEAFPVLSKYQIPATVFLIAESMETGKVAWYDRIFLILQALPSGRLDFHGLNGLELSTEQSRLQAAIEIMSFLRSLPDWRRKDYCADLESRVKLNERDLTGRILTWNQVKTMQRAGIAFGSHTVTHPVVGRLTPRGMEKELTESKRLLEARLECPVLDFAFPFGQLTDCGLEDSSSVVLRCGYRSASTTVPGVNTSSTDLCSLRRVQIGEERNLAMFAFRLNQFFLTAGYERVARSFSSTRKPGHFRETDNA